MPAGGGWAAMFPDEVWEHIFSFIAADGDRNAVSLVCRGWYRIERRSRRRIFVGNCYAVAPAAAVRRFPDVRAASIKGKPHFADFNLVPSDWGGSADAWVAAMAEGWPHLEELRLNRMVVTDDCLELIARSFKNFSVLALSSCEGFSTVGLAANCRPPILSLSLSRLLLPVLSLDLSFLCWERGFGTRFRCSSARKE